LHFLQTLKLNAHEKAQNKEKSSFITRS